MGWIGYLSFMQWYAVCAVISLVFSWWLQWIDRHSSDQGTAMCLGICGIIPYLNIAVATLAVSAVTLLCLLFLIGLPTAIRAYRE